MGQVVKFFGWLVMGIGATLAVFSHLTIGFVYGWDKLVQGVAVDPAGTALTIFALAPGGLLYGFGVLLEKWAKSSDEKWAAKQAAAKAAGDAEAPPPQAES